MQMANGDLAARRTPKRSISDVIDRALGGGGASPGNVDCMDLLNLINGFFSTNTLFIKWYTVFQHVDIDVNNLNTFLLVACLLHRLKSPRLH